MARQSGSRGGDAAGAQEITESWAVSALPHRGSGAHKWEVGGVVVVAGSPAYAGAAALCCAGAGRSGAGIVSVAVPRSIAHIVVGLVPEATVVLLPEGESTSAARRSAEAITERLERSKALVIGPGLGMDDTTSALLAAIFGATRARSSIGFGAGNAASTAESVIAKVDKPVVVDADALNWLADQELWWERAPSNRLVLTPHAGEMARLLKLDTAAIVESPVEHAREAARRWSQTIVLKGGKTLVVDPDGVVMCAETSLALATAGSGDVLSGSIGAFLAQGLSPRDASALAVYVGNRAAIRLAGRLSTLGVVASDLPLAIAEELRALEGQGS